MIIVYSDLRQLIEVEEGRNLTDVTLIGDDGGEGIKAHKYIFPFSFLFVFDLH